MELKGTHQDKVKGNWIMKGYTGGGHSTKKHPKVENSQAGRGTTPGSTRGVAKGKGGSHG